MWLIPYPSSTSSVWSATAWVTPDSAAAPKITRVLRCPVRPNSAVSIAMVLTCRWSVSAERLLQPPRPAVGHHLGVDEQRGAPRAGQPLGGTVEVGDGPYGDRRAAEAAADRLERLGEAEPVVVRHGQVHARVAHEVARVDRNRPLGR